LNKNRIFAKFVLYFGPLIFIIWKYILLNKRIVFYSRPPIGELCSRLFCASQMNTTSIGSIVDKQLIKPFFYVNITDIDELEKQPFYIACTTERILEDKKSLFDLFVNETNLQPVLNENLKNLCKINSLDKKRFELLSKKLYSSKIESIEDENIFISFFIEHNDIIFSTLRELEADDMNTLNNDSFNNDKKIFDNLKYSSVKRRSSLTTGINCVTSKHMKQMGLDPSDDKDFINEIIRFYDFNLIVNY
jgi:hypothetical protein